MEEAAMDHKSPSHADLVADGWTRRLTADGERLMEAARTYRGLGFEVRLEPVDLCSPGCAACLHGAPESIKIIYTRGPQTNRGLC